jgi:plasmid segregation protein ParM
MSTHNLVVRSIDVGHGNNKFTTHSIDEGFGCGMFPSIAPQSRSSTLSGGVFTNGDCIEVIVDGAKLIVGKDSIAEANSATTRIVDKEFCLSNVYLALLRGSLSYMKQPKIDLLVLGLPLTTYQSHRDALREKMTGGHKIFNPNRATNPSAPEFMSVEVAAVRVVPQPVGAFFNYSIPRGIYDEMNQQRNLVLDIGFGTFDWFVADGNTPIKSRCDANQSGISSVINAVADSLGDVKNNFEIMNRIDKALRTKSSFRCDGKEVDLMGNHWKYAENAIRESITSMLSGIGNIRDIDNILVTGGGADLFFEELQKAIPGHQLIKDDEPIFSNVKGFQMLGEMWAADIANGNKKKK